MTQCQARTYKDKPCRREAMRGMNLCDTHGMAHQYFIQFTWQEHANDHWTMRKKAYWPLLFTTKEAAEDLLFQGNVYRNMPNRRKLTACVERTKVKLPLPELQPFKQGKWS